MRLATTIERIKIMTVDILFYIDRAKTKNNIKSNGDLSKLLNLSRGAISQFTTGRAYPSDETMKELALLAHEDEELALMHLNLWRSPESVKETYAAILQKISRVTASIAIIAAAGLAFTASPALAKVSTASAEFVYYGK